MLEIEPAGNVLDARRTGAVRFMGERGQFSKIIARLQRPLHARQSASRTSPRLKVPERLEPEIVAMMFGPGTKKNTPDATNRTT